MHQALNRMAYQAKTMLDAHPTVAHHLKAADTDSPIWTIYQMITKHPQNEIS